MSGAPKQQSSSGDNKPNITILLVDDIPETRENIKKMLGFESDFKVIGGAGTGREGLEMAKQFRPDIIIMDINMPDMDGLEAAGRINKQLPATGIIMMSVQDDPDYFQKAMLAGARFFLPKPVNLDKLFMTVRSVYDQMGPMRTQINAMNSGMLVPIVEETPKQGGDRPGHVIGVYSPQGGVGKTMIATSLAAGLMREGIKTLLIDGDFEFGDVGAFLDLRGQTSLVEVVEDLANLDPEYFDSLLMTHNSGIKVLLAPPRPNIGADLRLSHPEAIRQIIDRVGGNYDFIIVDMPRMLDDANRSVIDLATKLVVVGVPTLPAIKNLRLLLDFFDQSGLPASKTSLVINKNPDASSRAARTAPSPEKIQAYLKRPIEAVIPAVEETSIIAAINRGVPVIASDRDTKRPPIAQLIKLSDTLYSQLMGEENIAESSDKDPKKSGSSWSLFGSNNPKK